MTLFDRLLRPRRWLQFVLLPVCVGMSAKAQSAHPCGSAELYATARVHGYVFKSYEPLDYDKRACLFIYRRGQIVYRMESRTVHRYDLGQSGDAKLKLPQIENGTNLSGNARADMIVTQWTGGAHCCFTKYVFELEPKLRVIARVDDGDSDLAYFEKRSDGAYEYLTGDIWSYWPGAFSSSVSHSVMLGWQGGTLRLDFEEMKAPPPTPEEWQAALVAVDAAVKEGKPLPDVYSQPLWGEVLQLIDTGHSELAWEFVREVNPASMTGNNVTLSDFCGRLAVSRYWTQIQPTLKDVPRECSAAFASAHRAKK